MKDKELLIEIGNNIKARRKELGMSQMELAKKVGYTSKATLSLIENGKRDISTPQLKKLANALDTSIDNILGIDKKVDLQISSRKAYDLIHEQIISYYLKLTDENKTIAENYLKFLLENQNKKEQ